MFSPQTNHSRVFLEPDWDHLFNKVLVRFKTNSGMVRLSWEHDLTSIRPNCRKHQCLTPKFHWIFVCCAWPWSSFTPPSGNPHWLRFESTMVQYGRQLALWGRGVPVIITWSFSTVVIGMCHKNNSRLCPWPEDKQSSLCLSLFWDVAASVNTECFILKSNQMSYWCFSALLPVC